MLWDCCSSVRHALLGQTLSGQKNFLLKYKSRNHVWRHHQLSLLVRMVHLVGATMRLALQPWNKDRRLINGNCPFVPKRLDLSPIAVSFYTRVWYFRKAGYSAKEEKCEISRSQESIYSKFKGRHKCQISFKPLSEIPGAHFISSSPVCWMYKSTGAAFSRWNQQIMSNICQWYVRQGRHFLKFSRFFQNEAQKMLRLAVEASAFVFL